MAEILQFESSKEKNYYNCLNVNPLDLLPILNAWKKSDPGKYATLVNMICISADMDPTEIIKNKNQ